MAVRISNYGVSNENFYVTKHLGIVGLTKDDAAAPGDLVYIVMRHGSQTVGVGRCRLSEKVDGFEDWPEAAKFAESWIVEDLEYSERYDLSVLDTVRAGGQYRWFMKKGAIIDNPAIVEKLDELHRASVISDVPMELKVKDGSEMNEDQGSIFSRIRNEKSMTLWERILAKKDRFIEWLMASDDEIAEQKCGGSGGTVTKKNSTRAIITPVEIEKENKLRQETSKFHSQSEDLGDMLKAMNTVPNSVALEGFTEAESRGKNVEEELFEYVEEKVLDCPLPMLKTVQDDLFSEVPEPVQPRKNAVNEDLFGEAVISSDDFEEFSPEIDETSIPQNTQPVITEKKPISKEAEKKVSLELSLDGLDDSDESYSEFRTELPVFPSL